MPGNACRQAVKGRPARQDWTSTHCASGVHNPIATHRPATQPHLSLLSPLLLLQDMGFSLFD
jgi:hypothetical protein